MEIWECIEKMNQVYGRSRNDFLGKDYLFGKQSLIWVTSKQNTINFGQWKYDWIILLFPTKNKKMGEERSKSGEKNEPNVMVCQN